MAQRNERFSDYGIDEDQAATVDRLFDLMSNLCRLYSLDELLLHPLEAHEFCDSARKMLGADQMPDDVILRPMMDRRKHP